MEKDHATDISLMGSVGLGPSGSVTERADERNSSEFLERFSFLRSDLAPPYPARNGFRTRRDFRTPTETNGTRTRTDDGNLR